MPGLARVAAWLGARRPGLVTGRGLGVLARRDRRREAYRAVAKRAEHQEGQDDQPDADVLTMCGP